VHGMQSHKDSSAEVQAAEPMRGSTRCIAHASSCTAGAAFLGSQLLTVGTDGNICVWALNAQPATSTAGTGSSTAALAFSAHSQRGSTEQPQQHSQKMQQELDGSTAATAATLQNWLGSRRLVGAASSGAAGGVAVVQEQPVRVDDGEWLLTSQRQCCCVLLAAAQVGHVPAIFSPGMDSFQVVCITAHCHDSGDCWVVWTLPLC
jgi:hypothetical protein